MKYILICLLIGIFTPIQSQKWESFDGYVLVNIHPEWIPCADCNPPRASQKQQIEWYFVDSIQYMKLVAQLLGGTHTSFHTFHYVHGFLNPNLLEYRTLVDGSMIADYVLEYYKTDSIYEKMKLSKGKVLYNKFQNLAKKSFIATQQWEIFKAKFLGILGEKFYPTAKYLRRYGIHPMDLPKYEPIIVLDEKDFNLIHYFTILIQ